MTTNSNKLTKLQKRVMDEFSPSQVLRIFLNHPQGRILTEKSGRLIIIPVYNPTIPKAAWDFLALYDEIKIVFNSPFIAKKVCEGKGSNHEIEAVCNWLLTTSSRDRLLSSRGM